MKKEKELVVFSIIVGILIGASIMCILILLFADKNGTDLILH